MDMGQEMPMGGINCETIEDVVAAGARAFRRGPVDGRRVGPTGVEWFVIG